MRRKISPMPVVFLLILIALGISSAIALPKTHSYYKGSEERLRKATVEKEYISEHLSLIDKKRRRTASDVHTIGVINDERLHRIDLRGEFPEPEKDRVFQPGEINFTVQ